MLAFFIENFAVCLDTEITVLWCDYFNVVLIIHLNLILMDGYGNRIVIGPFNIFQFQSLV